MISTKNFESEERFVKTFAKLFVSSFVHEDVEDIEKLAIPVSDFIQKEENDSLDELFAVLSEVCANASRPIVLLIDEVDQASNHQVFIDFLALLRGYYLNRENKPAFHYCLLIKSGIQGYNYRYRCIRTGRLFLKMQERKQQDCGQRDV